MEWVKVIMIVILLGRAIYTDVKTGLIENRNIVCGLLTAFLWSYCNDQIDGLAESCRMVVLIFVILFVLYVIKGLGGGDVKLFCVLAAWMPKSVLDVVVVSFLVAAVMSMGKMMVRGVQRKTLYVPGETMKFSIPMGIATAIVTVEQYCG